MAAQGGAVRALVAGAVGLVVGLALGGLAPRAEIRSLNDKVEALEDGSNCKSRGVGRELASAFQGRPMRAALDADEADAIDRAQEDEADVEEGGEDGVRFEFNVGEGEEQSQDPEQAIQLAKDAMELRRSQARAALDEQVRPSDEQWDAIDAAVEKMNGDLRSLAGEFTSTLQDGQEPTRREAMIFASDTLDVLLDADDAIWDTLSDDQRAAVEDEAIDPLAHVDPALLDLFLELDREQ